MANIAMYLLLYLLCVAAIAVTVGLAWFLIIGRKIAIKEKGFGAMGKRIQEARELNGRATTHKCDTAYSKVYKVPKFK